MSSDNILPEIRISFAHLLYSSESKLLADAFGKPLKKSSFYQEKTRKLQQAWADDKQLILQSLTEILGVDFYKNVIDVHLAPFFRPASHPLILNFSYEDSSHFVDSLTHELIHILLVDNSLYQTLSSDGDILNRWKDLFGERPVVELVHIAVHSLLKFIYLDVHRDPSRLARDIRICETYAPYANAWRFVDSHDYCTIIEQLRKCYL